MTQTDTLKRVPLVLLGFSLGDKGYIGEPSIKTPHKKPKNRGLTASQKQQNKEFSSQRILVEHLIRKVKIFRIASERFRLNPEKYEQVILIICGLVRLRIGALILPINPCVVET